MAPGSPIMPVPTSSRFCDCCNTTFHSVKALLAHQRDMETQRTQNINPAKTKAKKRKINHANHHRTENQRKTTGRKNLNNVITGLSNFEVAEIPCNETGTFIKNIIVKCTFCSKTFDRYDEYLLHYGEEHARLYGMLPNLSNDNADENINNKEGNDPTFDAVIDHSHKKSSCTPKVFNNDETDTSGDSHTSDDETAEKPIAVVEKDDSNIIVEKTDFIDSVEMPNDNVNGVPKRKRKRDSSKSKQTDGTGFTGTNLGRTKAKKRKMNGTNHHRTENQRKTTGRKNLNNVITGLSNSEVAEIPCNNSWTFIGNIIVKCTFCPKTFNRPDAYLLHYRDKHDTVDMEPNSSNRYHYADENINNKECNDVDAVVNHSHKKRRCTPKVLHNDETDTSSDSDTSDDETAEIPIAVVEKDNRNTIVEKAYVIDSVETPNENGNGVSKRKRKRDSSKSKQTDDHSSSSSDSDDSILEAQIENLLNTYVSKLTDLAKEFKDEIIKMKKKQRKRTYKCDTCSLHFGKKGEWRRHMKKFRHSDTKKPQRSHSRRNSHKKILQENKMHILETDTGTEDNNTGNDTEFDDEDQTTAPNSISENRRKSVKEPSQVNENQETNGPETENEHNEDTQVEPETVQIKAKKGENILYKCDDCEEHFLNIYYAEKHRSLWCTHHKTKKKYACDICMIIFGSSAALKTHKSEHKDLCLTKDDFKIIPWRLRLIMPENRQTVNPEAKIRRNKLKSPVTNTGNVSENELCKVVLSKATNNSWVASMKNGRKSTDENDNESNLNTNDTVRQNPHADKGTDSNDQITIENGVQSPDNTSYLSTVTENINNTDTTIKLENPQNQILPNVHDHLNTANATNSMGKITKNNCNTNISTTNTGYKKNSQSFKEFEPENDNFIPETRTDYNPNNPLGDIKITERYSTRLKFEEPDGQNSFETPTSSRIHSNSGVNIAADRTPRQHNNVHYNDDDSRSTLILSEVPIDLKNHRHDGVIESNHTENIGTPTATDINNEDDEHNQFSEEADDDLPVVDVECIKQKNPALGPDSYGLGAGSAIAAAASQAIAATQQAALGRDSYGLGAGSATAAAASQAIAATQQMASGCRSISMKASYDAVASGELPHHTLYQAQHTTHLDQGLLSSHSYSSGMHGRHVTSHAHSYSSASNKTHNKQNLNFNMVNNMAMEESVEEKYDPNGPRYCICNQISDGYMIGCDNQECPYQWFHWQCVGITAAPKGKWYCPQCRTNMCRNR